LIHRSDGSAIERRLIGQSQRIESLVFSPDGGLLAVVGGSPGRFGEVQFWETKGWTLKLAVRATYDTLYGGAFTPDAKKFSFGCADNSARVIDVEDGKETLKIDHHNDWVFATAFSKDGKHLITLGRDGAIKLTELATGSFIDDIGKNYGELKVMARNPTDDQVVIGGDERVPRLYKIFRTQVRDMNYTDFNLIRAFEAQSGGPLSAIAFSPDGSKIAVGGLSGEAPIFQVVDGVRVATLKGFAGGVYSIAFAPDGARVAIGGYDGQIRVYEVSGGKLLTTFAPAPMAARVASAEH
jgi:WD40 repeat protein